MVPHYCRLHIFIIRGHLVVAPIQLLDLAKIDGFLFLQPKFRNAKLVVVVASDGANLHTHKQL